MWFWYRYRSRTTLTRLNMQVRYPESGRSHTHTAAKRYYIVWIVITGNVYTRRLRTFTIFIHKLCTHTRCQSSASWSSSTSWCRSFVLFFVFIPRRIANGLRGRPCIAAVKMVKYISCARLSCRETVCNLQWMCIGVFVPWMANDWLSPANSQLYLMYCVQHWFLCKWRIVWRSWCT